MRRLWRLFWLSWREISVLVYFGFGIFLLFPFISDVSEYLTRQAGNGWSIDTGIYTNLSVGGVFAVILGVALTSPDMAARLSTFMGSRAIPLFPLYFIKYLVGLLAVTIVPALPILIDIACLAFIDIGRVEHYRGFYVLVCHTPVVVLIFSCAFLAGCLLRKAVESALLSTAAGMIIYFFPIVFPPLEKLSVISLINEGHWDNFSSSMGFYFSAFMIVSLATFILSFDFVRRNVAIPINQKSIVWGLGVVLILLFASGSNQIGSNLDCEQLVKWEGTQRSITNIVVKGDRILLRYQLNPRNYSASGQMTGIQILNISKSGLVAEDPVNTLSVGESRQYGPLEGRLIWPIEHSRYAYTLQDVITGTTYRDSKRTCLDLCTIDLQQATRSAIIHRLDLFPLFPQAGNAHVDLPRLYYDANGHLFVNAHKLLATINLSDPAKPVYDCTSAIDYSSNIERLSPEPDNRYTIQLPTIDGLSPHQRLNAWFEWGFNNYAKSMSGNIWPRYVEGTLTFDRLTGLDESEAVFQVESQIRNTPLERMNHNYYPHLLIHNGYCYALHRGGLAVFDIHDPEHPKRAGHYNAPSEEFGAIAPLPNGRVLLGGNNLHVIAPPM